MDEVLAKAPVDILIHFDLWPAECEKQNPKNVYPMLPPIFSSKKEYLNLFLLKRHFQLSAEGKETVQRKPNRNQFGHDNLSWL